MYLFRKLSELESGDYKQLLAVANAPTAERPRLAKLALERWTRVLAASGAPTQPGQVGYLGHWALPMALVVMLWEVDDVGLRAHPHYPSDPVAHYRGTTRR